MWQTELGEQGRASRVPLVNKVAKVPNGHCPSFSTYRNDLAKYFQVSNFAEGLERWLHTKKFISVYIRIYQDISKYIKIYQNISKYIKIY